MVLISRNKAGSDSAPCLLDLPVFVKEKKKKEKDKPCILETKYAEVERKV